MQQPNRRPTVPAPILDQPGGLPLLMVAALAVGAAGFGFGAYFYAVPFHRKAAQLERAQKELAARPLARRRVDVQGEDVAARTAAQLKALEAQVRQQLDAAGATVTVGANRLVVRFTDEKLWDAHGPKLATAGQEAVQALGGLLGPRVHRVVISAPMGNAIVPRWVKGLLPTPADLSAARAGNALKAAVKGGARAETVLAVVGTLALPDTEGSPSLDFEIEP
jgi:flagellar motor protein MotB